MGGSGEHGVEHAEGDEERGASDPKHGVCPIKWKITVGQNMKICDCFELRYPYNFS